MSKKWLIATTIALNAAIIPLYSHAEETATTDTSVTDTQNTNTVTEISKDNWLNAIKPQLPKLICEGFLKDTELKKRFDELKITYEQCVGYVPESATMCQDKIYPNIPDKITNDSASTWGKALGECIGQDFAQKYLMPKTQ